MKGQMHLGVVLQHIFGSCFYPCVLRYSQLGHSITLWD